MKRFLSRFKIVLSLLFVILGAGTWLTWYSVARCDREMRADLLDQTALLAHAINPEYLEPLSGTAEDLENPRYLRLKAQLAAVRTSYPKCQSLYLMGRKPDGTLYFFLDTSRKKEALPGKVYHEASKELQGVFDTRQPFVEGPLPDEWGVWISGIVPVVHPKTTKVLAVLGMDIDARDWNQTLALSALPPALLTLALATIGILGNILLDRRSRRAGPPALWMRHLEQALAFAAGLALTLCATWMIHQREIHDRRLAFAQLAAGRTETICDALQTLRNIELDSLARFYESDEEVISNEFQQFTTTLVKNPTVQGWGWIEAVPAHDQARFEAQARSEGSTDFSIWQKDAQGKRVPATGRDIFYPIRHAVPMAENAATLGYDIGSEPKRRAALEEAARSGLVTSTDPVTLVHKTEDQKALMIYRPVFANGEKSHLRGFVLAMLHIKSLLRNSAHDKAAMLEISLLHGGAAPEPLVSAWNADKRSDAELSAMHPVLAFGKVFCVTAHPGPEFMRWHPVNAAWLTALTGLILSAALALVIDVIYRHRTKLEHQVNKRTRELQASKDRYAELAEQSSIIVWEVNDQGLYTYVSPASEPILGYHPDELIQRMHFYDLHPESGREAGKTAAFAVFERKEWFKNFTNEALTKHGEKIWLSTNGIPLLNADGSLKGYRGTDTEITQRKLAEDAVRSKTALLEAQTNATLDGILVINEQHKRVLTNQRIHEMFKVPASILADEDDAALLKHVVSLTKDPEHFLAKVTHLYEHPDETSHDEIEFKNGMILERYSAPVIDTHGKYHGRIWSFHDVTNRKLSEEALRESETRHRSVLTAMAEGIVVQSTNGTIIDCNQSAEKILNLSRDQILGLTSLDPRWQAVTEDDLPLPGDQHPAMVSLCTGQPCHNVTMGLHLPNGTQRWILVSAEPIFSNGETRPHAVVTSFTDITERRQTEESLRIATERLTLATRAGAVGIWDYDVPHNHLIWDSQMFRLYGIAPDRFSGAYEAWQTGLHPDDKQRAHAELQMALDGEMEFDTEFRVLWPDGSIHNIRALALVQRNSSGQALRMIGTNWDITTDKQAEAALVDSNRKLEAAIANATEMSKQAQQANLAKGEFLANMSHEIRTPMNGVIGMTDLLLNTPLNPEQRHCAEIVHSSAEALLHLINDILDFSKIEAGKLDLEILDFNLLSLLENFTDLFIPQARKKGLEFSCDIAPDVPAGICGDAARLRQILTNLTGNAIKFTPHGKVTVQVSRVSSSAASTVLRFAVRDTGIGIPAAKQAMLFQKFTQLDPSTARHFGGTGLGLAISKQLAQLMDGEIGVSSVVGLGSEFWFTACFSSCLHPVPAPALSAAATHSQRRHWHGLRILLAEDNLINQKVALGFLKPFKFHVDVVSNGLDVLHALGTMPYDLVLMDLQMPGMDGLEATRRIRAPHSGVLNAGVPIVAMTANAMQGDREKCLGAGMNDYLSKPVTPGSLTAILEKWLPRKPTAPP